MSSSLLLILSRFIARLLYLFNPSAAAPWMRLRRIQTRVAFILKQQILLGLTLNHTIFSTLWMWYLLSALRNYIVVVDCVFLGHVVGNGDWRRCVYVLLCYVCHCKTLLVTRSWPLIIWILVQNYLLMTLLGQNNVFLIAFKRAHSVETFTSCFQNWVDVFAHLHRFFGIHVVILLFCNLLLV